MTTSGSPILVLTPLRLERAHIRRALAAAHLPHIPIIQTGIGKDAIIRAVNAAAGSAHPPHLIILAGAAGGLAPCTDCPPIAQVIEESNSHRWIPFGTDKEPDAVTLVGVDRIVSTPADKHALARHTNAAIVDMESHAFAAHCTRLNIRWSVVRAVSDTPDEVLPHEVLNWISPAGNERHLRAAWDLLRRPSLLSHIRPVMQRSKRVLPLAGQRVAALIQAWQATHSPTPHTAPAAAVRT